MSNDFRHVRRAEPQRKAPVTRFAAGVVIAYSLIVLGLAAFLGSRIYSWSLQNTVENSVLATVVAWLDAPATLQSATPGDVATGAAETVAAAGATAEAAAAGTPVPVTPNINILLLGTDERPDEGDAARTDTMILVSVNPETRDIGMLSMPRDLWVPVPGMNTTTKINTAYLMGELYDYPGGGPQAAKDTVSSFVGRPVDYFVRVNFDGFRQMIDLIGGIDVDVPYVIHDDQYPTEDYGVEIFHLDAGRQHLDGVTALKYARTRHGDDDYSRSRRQQDIIRSVVSQVLSAGMIPQLLGRAPQLLMTMQNSVQTDIPLDKGFALANLVADGGLGEIRQLVLDSKYGTESYSAEGAWILVPDRQKVRVALDEFFEPSIAASGGVAIGDPAAARIEILNGTGQPGMAARTKELLEAQGWQVVAIGDADRGDYTQTIVINYRVNDTLVTQVSSDLEIDPQRSRVPGMNPNATVDMRIVIGADVLAVLGN